ncbi:MAG: 2-succinyl-5-enolpyruvyl-6-hydroxy-3-cyclohexene-1-carboxylic-acid synthase [Alloprevotella sp.]|nr:2-succinyl-5-enolpyruvyl-6-hydroxy-3-cyclohexene-1-carboxylic-acid synthase [Alloprevotella sp.]
MPALYSIPDQLTALLLAHEVHDFVLCPGARNADLISSLCYFGHDVGRYPVTDERSAAFTALGISLCTGRPTAVCVTSGTALLNTLPAVAEAYYRHIPLLVISADRPRHLHGQLDGQTIPQEGALKPYAPTYQLPEGDTPDAQRTANRRINEALAALHRHGGQPVHINVPLGNPQYSFTARELPYERFITDECSPHPCPIPKYTVQRIAASPLPILLLGQLDAPPIDALRRIEENNSMLILPDLLANTTGWVRERSFQDVHLPEKDVLIVHTGGHFTEKRLKEMFRQRSDLSVIRIEPGESYPDTLFHLSHIVRATPAEALAQLADELPPHATVAAMKSRLQQEADEKESPTTADILSDEVAMQTFVRTLEESSRPISALHLGNSRTVRLAQRYLNTAPFRIHCNRGTNGIDGSVSTAAGYSLKSGALTLLYLGDLSFLYDNNGLWNTALDGRLRIVVVNNGGGRIFHTLPSLKTSPALEKFIAGGHTANAEGICNSYGVTYHSARTPKEMHEGLRLLLDNSYKRPALLELFTQPI